MVDLRANKSSSPPMQVGRLRGDRSMLSPRERIRLAVFAAISLVFIVVWLAYYNPIPVGAPSDETIQEIMLPNLQRPDLAALPAFPTPAELEGKDEEVARMRAEPDLRATVLSLKGPEDPVFLAWCRDRLQRDRQQGVIPQGLAIGDLGRLMAADVPVILSGQLLDLRVLPRAGAVAADPEPQPEDWYALTLAATQPDGRTAYALALVQRRDTGESDGKLLDIGLPVRLVGRYVGHRYLPAMDAGDGAEAEARMPIVVARALSQREDDLGGVSLPGVGSDERFTGPFRADPEVFEQIDDIGVVLEKRPYYQMLGQVRADASRGGYAEPADGLAHAFKLHKEPSTWRGETFTVDGMVWDAWWDHEVARDQPWDIQQVQRIRFFKRVYGVSHTVADYEGNERESDASFLHAFEVAVLCPKDRPLPKTGELITVTGRFLKVQGYPINPNRSELARYNMQVQSSNAYFKFFVAQDYRLDPAPRRPDFTWIAWGFFIFACSFLGFMVLLIRRDESHADDYKRSVRRLRESRRELARRKRNQD